MKKRVITTLLFIVAFTFATTIINNSIIDNGSDTISNKNVETDQEYIINLTNLDQNEFTVLGDEIDPIDDPW